MIKESSSYFSIRNVGSIILIALVYFVSAKLGLLFAYKNTNITPIWPSSGIAFTAIILFGYRIWPGIMLGAFLSAFFSFPTYSITTISVASFLIGIGNYNWFPFSEKIPKRHKQAAKSGRYFQIHLYHFDNEFGEQHYWHCYPLCFKNNFMATVSGTMVHIVA